MIIILTLFDATRFDAWRFLADVRGLVAAAGGSVAARSDGDRLVLMVDGAPDAAPRVADRILDEWFAWRDRRRARGA